MKEKRGKEKRGKKKERTIVDRRKVRMKIISQVDEK